MASLKVSEDTKRVLERLYSPMYYDTRDEFIRDLIVKAGFEEELEKAGEKKSAGNELTSGEGDSRPRNFAIKLPKPDRGEETINGDTQSEIMGNLTQFLINEWELLEEIELPYKPSSSRMTKLLISESKSYSRDDKQGENWTMRGFEQLKDPRDGSDLYIDTNMDRGVKVSRIEDLVNEIDELDQSDIVWGEGWNTS